eukprot:2213808-Rhodomonas_salina.2
MSIWSSLRAAPKHTRESGPHPLQQVWTAQALRAMIQRHTDTRLVLSQHALTRHPRPTKHESRRTSHAPSVGVRAGAVEDLPEEDAVAEDVAALVVGRAARRLEVGEHLWRHPLHGPARFAPHLPPSRVKRDDDERVQERCGRAREGGGEGGWRESVEQEHGMGMHRTALGAWRRVGERGRRAGGREGRRKAGREGGENLLLEGHAEVSDAGGEAAGHEDVEGLEVAVHEAQVVDVLEPERALLGDAPRRRRVELHLLLRVQVEQRALLADLRQQQRAPVRVHFDLRAHQVVAVGVVQLLQQRHLETAASVCVRCHTLHCADVAAR